MKPKHILTLFFIPLLLFSCKDDDAMPDPCEGEVETTAEFGFYNKLRGTDSTYWLSILDTVYNLPNGGGGEVYFRANSSEMKSYKWKVGLDPRVFEDSVFSLTFSDIEGVVSVKLEVEHDPLEDCFPDDTGRAELTKAIYMKRISSTAETPIYGSYQGYDVDDPENLYTIGIPELMGRIHEFPKDCERLQGISILVASRRFVFDEKAGYTCGHPTGGGVLQADNKTLIIDYKVEDENNPDILIEKRFIGTKIN